MNQFANDDLVIRELSKTVLDCQKEIHALETLIESYKQLSDAQDLQTDKYKLIARHSNDTLQATVRLVPYVHHNTFCVGRLREQWCRCGLNTLKRDLYAVTLRCERGMTEAKKEWEKRHAQNPLLLNA